MIASAHAASAYIWLFAGGMILTAGDIVFKLWADRSDGRLYCLGLMMYLLGGVCLVQTFKSHNIAVASALYVLFNIATLTLVSWLWFHDVPSRRQLAGLGFGALSILLMM